MKSLVYYCRWQRASLRLRGRDDTTLWGHLVFLQEDGREELREFRFSLRTSELTLRQDVSEQTLFLDEKGIPIASKEL